MDPALVARVQHICDVAGAQVVVSSGWQCTDPWDKILVWLRRAGLTAHIAGFTTGQGTNRGHEIWCWMQDMGVGLDQVVVLDDDSDVVFSTPQLRPRWIQTGWGWGLTDDGMKQAIALFTGT